ncbi:MAG: DUF2232 domain-containing protein [Solobacterium sp.]|nr:DUF2232 domain-containing protein [Solobacterium sp.]MBR3342947.1 DUF2232 domain-containing protein [Solobacterium sp.]HAE15872.1 hypothetical protein [Erysipelotrichaceae bacterium]
MNSNVRKITDGAMMCAIIGVMLVADRFLGGLFSGSFMFVLPLPMVFFATKYGMRDSWMVLAAMSFLAFIISGPQMLFYIAAEGLLGLIYGAGVHDHKPTEHLIISAIVIAVFVNVMSMVVLAAFFGYNLTEDVAFMQDLLNNAASSSGVAVPSSLTNAETLKTLLIVGAAVTGILEGLVTHLLSRIMMKRLRLRVEPLKPIAYYYPPKWTGYLAFAGFAAYEYVMLRPFADTMVQNACVGVGMLGVVYLLAFGCVFVLILFSRRRRKGSPMAGLLAFLLLFTAPIMMVIIGFLYITTDIHQRLLEGDTTNAEKND